MKKLLFVFVFSIALLAINSTMVNAQCAMCRATVESSSKDVKGQGKGLNTGILYLMVIPYILAGGIGYFWYKNSKKPSGVN